MASSSAGKVILSTYQRLLLESRNRGHTLGRAAIQRLNTALADALERIVLDSAHPLSRLRAIALRGQIINLLESFEQRVVNETSDAVRLTVIETVLLHQRAIEKLIRDFAARDADLATTFNAVSVRALQALVSRERNAAIFKTLIRRNLVGVAPQLDTLLGSAVARGISSAELTKDIAALLRGEFPSLTAYGYEKTAFSDMRTVLSDARRIARSEVNNAMREANRMSLDASPIVVAAKWQISGNHPAEDECDDLATADEFGYGPGFWRMDEWPVAPHPNCGCYPGEVAFRPIEDWDQPKVYDDIAPDTVIT